MQELKEEMEVEKNSDALTNSKNESDGATMMRPTPLSITPSHPALLMICQLVIYTSHSSTRATRTRSSARPRMRSSITKSSAISRR